MYLPSLIVHVKILQNFHYLKINHNEDFIPFLAAASSEQNFRHGYLWSPNVENVFKYTSPNLIKALRKTIQPSSIISGHPLKFVADLKLQAFSDNTLRVKLDHTLFYSDGTGINLEKAHQILDDGRSIRTVMFHTEQTFQQFLTAPFLIHVKRGVVKTVIVSQNEPSEVTSIKKLIASEFENKDRHPQLQLLMKRAIITPLEIPRHPMKVDLGNFEREILVHLNQRSCSFVKTYTRITPILNISLR